MLLLPCDETKASKYELRWIVCLERKMVEQHASFGASIALVAVAATLFGAMGTLALLAWSPQATVFEIVFVANDSSAIYKESPTAEVLSPDCRLISDAFYFVACVLSIVAVTGLLGVVATLSQQLLHFERRADTQDFVDLPVMERHRAIALSLFWSALSLLVIALWTAVLAQFPPFCANPHAVVHSALALALAAIAATCAILVRRAHVAVDEAVAATLASRERAALL